MRNSIVRWARFALVLSAVVLPGTAVAAAPSALPPVVPPPAVDVTEADIAASNVKIRSAYGALVAMWTTGFDDAGVQFAAPGLVRYRGPARTACGVMSPNNAAYCPALNTIYFDEVFIARQASSAARALGTDGDMAAVGVIAHEVGHAVASQLGMESPIPLVNEAMADCFAGAFAQHSQRDGSLEEGDLEEAFFGLAAAGDPTPEVTGNRRMDARIRRQAQLMGHGTREQRLAHFTVGYENGARACMAPAR